MIFILQSQKKFKLIVLTKRKNYEEITEEQYQIILACRKTPLKDNDSTWIKTGLDNFDVPMGGYNSAQIADLVGLYIYQIPLVESLTRYKLDYTIMTVFNTSPTVMVLSVLVNKKGYKSF